jgi:hypothetical protein
MSQKGLVTVRQLAVLGLIVCTSFTPGYATICVDRSEDVRGIRGIVIEAARADTQQAILPGVTVTIQRRGFKATTVTDNDGYFTFQDLPHGDYDLVAALEGFLTAYGTARVRDDAAANLVLVIELTIFIDDCSGLRTEPVDRARDIQRDGKGSANP